MRILFVYPNLPLMMAPALSFALFDSICKENDVETDIFETTNYTDDVEKGMIRKTKIGNGREFTLDEMGNPIKPTWDMIPDFVAKVHKFKPDIMLISVVEDVFDITRQLLQSIQSMNIPSIVGGVFAINAPYTCLNDPLINVICRYEGELVIKDVISSFKKGMDWRKVKGLWYKDNDKIIRNESQPLVDLNDVRPDYSLFSDYRFNRPMGGRIVKSVPVETYRGCPYSCTFCNSPMTRFLDKNYLRRKSVETVEAELNYYVKEINPNHWFFLDDSFLARPRKENFELLKVIKKFNIPWWCNTRLENIDEELLDAMKEAHVDRIQFGIESGDYDYRKNTLLRKVSDELYLQKAEVLNKSEIPYGLNVIVGMPDETKEMALSTARLIQKIGGNDSLGISIFIPYRGTQLRELAVAKGYIDDRWIATVGLNEESPLDMPKPYLQKNEIKHLLHKFKYYAFFNERFWSDIDKLGLHQLDGLEKIWQQYYPKLAIGGMSHIKNKTKNKWACSSPEHMDIRLLA